MINKYAVLFAALAVGSVAKAEEPKEMVEITIASKISVEKGMECDYVNEAKEDGKSLSEKWSQVRGVLRVETSVDSDSCGGACSKDEVRSEDTNDEKEVSSETSETKCGCGKPKTKKCSSCGKCSSCSSCDKCSSCCH